MENTILTIKKINYSGKWVEFWFEEETKIEEHSETKEKFEQWTRCSKIYQLNELIEKANLSHSVLNNGLNSLVGNRIVWSKENPIEILIADDTKRKNISVELDRVLSLISCSRDYGFSHDILFYSFSKMLMNKLTIEEIESYARDLEATEGYGHEDYLESKERLLKFKAEYIDNKSEG